MINFKILGEIKRLHHGLTDYYAEGVILQGNDEGDSIPCYVGLNAEKEPTHLFVNNGFTKNGSEYLAETIKLTNDDL